MTQTARPPVKWIVPVPADDPYGEKAFTPACRGHKGFAAMLNYLVFAASKEVESKKADLSGKSVTVKRNLETIADYLQISPKTAISYIHQLAAWKFIVPHGYQHTYDVCFPAVTLAMRKPPPAEWPKLRGKHVKSVCKSTISPDEEIEAIARRIVDLQTEIVDLQTRMVELQSQNVNLQFAEVSQGASSVPAEGQNEGVIITTITNNRESSPLPTGNTSAQIAATPPGVSLSLETSSYSHNPLRKNEGLEPPSASPESGGQEAMTTGNEKVKVKDILAVRLADGSEALGQVERYEGKDAIRVVWLEPQGCYVQAWQDVYGNRHMPLESTLPACPNAAFINHGIPSFGIFRILGEAERASVVIEPIYRRMDKQRRDGDEPKKPQGPPAPRQQLPSKPQTARADAPPTSRSTRPPGACAPTQETHEEAVYKKWQNWRAKRLREQGISGDELARYGRLEARIHDRCGGPAVSERDFYAEVNRTISLLSFTDSQLEAMEKLLLAEDIRYQGDLKATHLCAVALWNASPGAKATLEKRRRWPGGYSPPDDASARPPDDNPYSLTALFAKHRAKRDAEIAIIEAQYAAEDAARLATVGGM